MSILQTGIVLWRLGVEGPQPGKLRITGKDNYGQSRQEFADKLAGLSDEELLKEAEQHIWLSAYAANNYRSDFHWQCDACYEEGIRRGKEWIYGKAWHRASGM